MNITPTVGRMVYYKTRGSADGIYPPKQLAAIVVSTDNLQDDEDEEIDLVVFYPDGIRFEHSVTHGEDFAQWDWMPFQKDQQARLGYNQSK